MIIIFNSPLSMSFNDQCSIINNENLHFLSNFLCFLCSSAPFYYSLHPNTEKSRFLWKIARNLVEFSCPLSHNDSFFRILPPFIYIRCLIVTSVGLGIFLLLFSLLYSANLFKPLHFNRCLKEKWTMKCTQTNWVQLLARLQKEA